MDDPLDFLICVTCGVQYSEPLTSESQGRACPVCDDPRQYVAAAGQTWTTLRRLRESEEYHNKFTPIHDKALSNSEHQLISIQTVPQVAIGQRALLCVSPQGGNVLWDCITYIDAETVATVKSYGRVIAIIISHPHYFSTCLHWAEALDCPIYISAEDEQWVMRRPGPDDVSRMVLWSGQRTEFGQTNGKPAEFVCVKTGGHFPGSSVLYWPAMKKLLVADTIFVVPSGVYHIDRPEGTASFSFMWSYPNMIPLPPDDILNIWRAIRDLDFEDTHSAFSGRDTYGKSKERVLESAKIVVRFMGHASHAIHGESI